MMTCDQRFLVGMTKGARKRAVQKALDAFDGSEIEDFVERYRWYLSQERRLRAEYRIGERLRPCPGCPSCNDLAEDQGEEDGQPIWFLHNDTEHPCDYACGGRWLRGQHCDGTSVRPFDHAARVPRQP